MIPKHIIAAKRKVRPQAAMLILYGDYLLEQEAELGIGSIITIFSNFGLSEQAVRSAVSRMCRSGLLKVRSSGRKSYYALTEYGLGLLTTGAARVLVRKDANWDGYWNIVTYSIPEENRKPRDVLRRELSWMGYGNLSGATMISPYDFSKVVLDLAKKLGITDHVHIFKAKQTGIEDAKKIVSTCWDLGRIHDIYSDFLSNYEKRYEEFQNKIYQEKYIDIGEYFTERFMLIHDYKRLPFYDPDLPEELLPGNWLRPRAVKLFNTYHKLLAEKATEYFNSVINKYESSGKTIQ